MNEENQPDPENFQDKEKKFTKSAIQWRRSQVLSYLVRGYSQADIVRAFKNTVDKSTISLDVQFLREQAKKEMETHLSDRLPFIHFKAMEGINNVLKKVCDIEEKAEDNKIKLECLRLRTELYTKSVILGSDGGFVERAMKMVKVISPLPGENIHAESQEDKDGSSSDDANVIEETDAGEDQAEE